MPIWLFLACTQGPGSDTGTPPPPISGKLEPVFATTGEGFWYAPWPSDLRLGQSGHPAVSSFPNPNAVDLVSRYLAVIGNHVNGFSTNPVVYFPFAELPGADDLPDPPDTLSEGSPVFLMALGEDCGSRVPVEVTRLARDPYVDANLLALAPVHGFPLEPGATYAAVITTSLGSVAGVATERPEEFEAAMAGEGDLFDAHDPLRTCLDTLGVDADTVAVATLFTTQDPMSELDALRDAVLATDAPVVDAIEELTDYDFRVWKGTYATPMYQTGVSPYHTSGGGIVFESDGTAVQQGIETVPFSVAVPAVGDGPFPLLVWEDGTGATLLHHLDTDPIGDALDAGFAVASFEPQFHGERATEGSNPILHTFNDQNPESGRSVLRQQVADTVYFLRVLREADLSSLPDLDTSTVVYGGQSQGALVGALTAGVEGTISAYVLNGIGGYLSETVVHRTDPIDINALLQAELGLSRDLTRFHPVVQLAQLGGDVSDPVNAAARWAGHDAKPSGVHVLLLNGQQDHTTPELAIAAVTLAGNVAPVEPVGFDVDPWGVSDLEDAPSPLSGNRTASDGSELTHGTILSADLGHYVIYDDAAARASALQFWTEALEGTPSITR